MYFVSFCGSLYPFIKLVKIVLNLLKIAVPIALMVFGAIDFGKAVIASKEDEMKKAQSIFIKRVIYAVAVFLVFTLVSFVMNFIASTVPLNAAGNPLDSSSWRACWNCESKVECDEISSACYWDYENSKTIWGDFYDNIGGKYLYLEEYVTEDECLKQEESACYLDLESDKLVWGPHRAYEGNGFSYVPSLTTEDQCLKFRQSGCYLEDETGKYVWGSHSEYEEKSGYTWKRGLKEEEQCLNHNN